MDLIRGARFVVVAGLLVGAVPGSGFAQGSQDPYFNFLMGRHLESDGNADGAIAALERAAAADPRSAEVRAEIASVHYRRNDRAAAEKAAKAALAIDPQNAEANRILGFTYALLAENQKNTPAQTATYVRDAVTHLERAQAGAQGPADPNINMELGRMYLVLNQSQKAIESLDRVVSQNPYSLRGRVLLAQAYASGRDLPMAIAVLRDVAEEAPQVLPALGQYQHRAGQFTDAVATFTAAAGTTYYFAGDRRRGRRAARASRGADVPPPACQRVVQGGRRAARDSGARGGAQGLPERFVESARPC